MRRQLGWLCILPALASLTPIPADASGASYSAAMQAASLARGVPLPLIEATAYVNSRWQWIATPADDGGVGPMHVMPSQMAQAVILSGHTQAAIAGDLAANLDAGAALLANAHTSGSDLASWQPAVSAVQGTYVATQIFDALRSGETATSSTGELIVLSPQALPNPTSPASPAPKAPSGQAPSAPNSANATLGGATFTYPPPPDFTPCPQPQGVPCANWVPANVNNFSYANRPTDYPVQLIVIHDIEGTAGAAIQAFQDPNRAASANYVVSDAGQITQMVREHDIAWHAGNWDYNTRAIGIEHEGYAYAQPTWYTKTMYDASAQLAASICSRWGVPLDRNHVIGHSEVPDPNNPALKGGSDHHTDPGPYWDWTYYIAQAQHDASLLPSPPRMMPDPVAVSSGSSATVTWQPAQTCHAPITSYIVTRQPDGASMTVPASARSATFSGMQTGVNYTFTVTATDTDQFGAHSDTLTAEWRCSAVSDSAVPASPQGSGTSITFTASATGCPHPYYQFWILPAGSSTWQIIKPYSTASMFTWDTTGQPAGTYSYTVWTQDASSNGGNCTYLGCNDAFFPGTAYSLTTRPCTSVTDSPSPSSPSPPGTPIVFTAAASSCPHPLYEFWLLTPGGSWQVVRPWSTTATFNWSTTGLPMGKYMYTVWARDSGSTGTSCGSFGCTDAYFPAPTYSLTNACGSVTDAAVPSSPQGSGTGITFTAGATGCPHPLYQFWILAPGHSWQVMQQYSSMTTFNWNTIGLPAGSYMYTVWARDSSSSGISCSYLGCNDTFFPGTPYSLTTAPCTSVTDSANPSSPQGSATPVTFTANASGCPHPLYQFWILAPGHSWQVMQPWSTTTTFNWNTTGLPAGSYMYTVWARDSGSTGTSCSYLGCNDAFSPGAPYSLTVTPCTSVTDSATPSSPQASGTSITFTALASGCSHPLYQFWVLRPGSSTWQIVAPYSSTATFHWVTTGLPAGKYLYTVWARDSSSSGTSCSYLGCNDAFFPGTAYTLS